VVASQDDGQFPWIRVKCGPKSPIRLQIRGTRTL
jgi:hypothetical protein